jgi:energy-coupling factor transport system permease protein
MPERLSFYIKRDSPIHKLNPFTKLTLVAAFIMIAFFSAWYWTSVSLILSIIILSLIAKVFSEYIGVAARMLLPIVGFLFLMQSFFLPVGKTELWNLGFLSLKAENIQIAFLNASRIFMLVSAFLLFLLTTHTSELTGDLTRRGAPPQIAYVLVSTLQIIPQMQAKAQTIIAAQRSRGLDTESTFIKRAGALVPLVGPLVFGSLVEVEERAIAIEARGFTSKKAKTSLYEIPDTKFDQTLRWVLVVLVIFSIALNIWLS